MNATKREVRGRGAWTAWLASAAWLSSAVAHAQRLVPPVAVAEPAHEGREWFAALLVLGVLAVLTVVVGLRAPGKASGPTPGPQARAWMNVDVSALRIAIDAKSRAFVERELQVALADGGAGARLASLQRVVRVLRKIDAAWMYGGSSNFHPMSPPVAETAFRRLVEQAREGLAKGIQRARDTGCATEGGEPVALITLAVAARREVRDFFGGNRAEILALLDDLDRLTEKELVTFDVVWSPAEVGGSIGVVLLQFIEPDLRKLSPLEGPPKSRSVPRLHCGYCRGPFAAVLPTCPHCGAPAPAIDAD